MHRRRDARLWVLLVLCAFVVLWAVSFLAARLSSPVQPSPSPEAAGLSPVTKAIGQWGWRIVGLGILGVLLAALPSFKPRRGSLGFLSRSSTGRRGAVGFSARRQARQRAVEIRSSQRPRQLYYRTVGGVRKTVMR